MNSTITVRLDADLKGNAHKLSESMGLQLADVMRMSLVAFVNTGRLPETGIVGQGGAAAASQPEEVDPMLIDVTLELMAFCCAQLGLLVKAKPDTPEAKAWDDEYLDIRRARTSLIDLTAAELAAARTHFSNRGAELEAMVFALPKPKFDDYELAKRRFNMEQAIADARIEGFVPDAEFLAETEAVIRGEMTNDELRERIFARAREMDRLAGAQKKVA
jgi:hypothetical protein